MKTRKVVPFVICFSFLFGCSDPAERSVAYLDSAKDFYGSGNYEKAKLELKNAIQIDNKLAEAFYYMALINEENENWKEMYGNLAQTIKLDPENQEARLKLGRLYLLSGNLEGAKIEVDWLLAKSPNSPGAIVLNGILFLKQGNAPAALAEAKKAISIDSGSTDAVGLLVSLYLLSNDFIAAETEINNALLKKPDDLELHVMKLQLHEKSGNQKKLELGFQDLIKRFPSKDKFSYALAKFYLNEKREDEALNILQTLVKSNPDKLKPKLSLADFLVAKDNQQAETILNTFITDNPGEPDFYFKLADLYINQGKYKEAKVPLKWVSENNKDDQKGLLAKVVLAKIALKNEDTATALSNITKVLKVDKQNYEALLLKARISVINKKYEEAITDLRGVLTDYADSDDAMVLLGQAYLGMNSPVLAEENFRNALELNPSNFSAVMPVVTRMLKSNDIYRADEILQNALKSNPNHPGALKVLAQIRLARKDWAGTKKVADLIAAEPRGEGFSNYLSGKIFQEQGVCEAAIEKFKRALTLTPSLSDALKSMMNCYETGGNRSEMHAYLDEFMQIHPEMSNPVFIKAKLYLLEGESDKALILLNKGINQWPEVYQFYDEVAKIYYKNNEPESAIIVYKRGLTKNPDNTQLRMKLAYAYEVQKNYAEAIKNYEMIVAKNPDVDPVVNNLVSLLLDHFPEKENFERAVVLSKRFQTSDEPFFRDTYGWALLQNGEAKKAVTILEQVVVMKPEVAVFKYHLGMSYHKSGDNLKATQLLEQALVAGSNQEEPFLDKKNVEILLEKIKAMPAE